MFYIRLSVILCVLLSSVLTERIRYDNYTLYKIHPSSIEHVEFLNDLLENYNGLDFWKPPSVVGEYVSVVSPPELRNDFEHSLSKRSIESELMLENIQEAFDAQIVNRRKRDASGQLYWTNYQTMEDIYAWFEYLADRHRDIVSLITIGQSHEGRNITGVRISRGSGRRVILLEGGQVAADWLSPTVLTYAINQLIYSEDSETRAACNDFDWHIFPILNPDGHEFTQNSVRLWVKNRRPINANAIGVDLTKNWNSHWGVSGASFNPAANNYAGLGPFSEIETRSMSRYIESIGSNLAAFFSLRSFGQRLFVPFAHTTEPMYNYREMVTLGRRAMGSLAVRYGTQYLVGTSREVHGPKKALMNVKTTTGSEYIPVIEKNRQETRSVGATGAAEDWVKYRFNPPIAGTYLLRDAGAWGYTLPVNQVQPSCEETFDSLIAIIREARFINVL